LISAIPGGTVAHRSSSTQLNGLGFMLRRWLNALHQRLLLWAGSGSIHPMSRRDISLLRWSLSHLRPYRGCVLLDAMLYLGSLALGLAQPILFRSFVDYGVMTHNAQMTVRFLAIIVTCLLLSLGLDHVRVRMQLRVTREIIVTLQNAEFQQILHSPRLYYTSYDPGNDAQVILNDSRSMAGAMFGLPLTLLSPLLKTVGYAAILSHISL